MKRTLATLLAALLLLGLILPGALAASFEVETILEPRYEDAKIFADGMAAVKQNGKWGYADTDGNLVIQPQFDLALDFSEGVAVVGHLVQEDGAGAADSAYYRLCLLKKDGTVIELMEETIDGESVPCRYYLYEWSEDVESAGQQWFCQNGVVNVNGTPFTADGREIKIQTGGLGESWDFFTMLGPCVNGVIPMRGQWAVDGAGLQCFYMDKTGKVTRAFPALTKNDTYGIVSVYAPEQERIVAYYGKFDTASMDWVGGWGAMDLAGSWKVAPLYRTFRYRLSGQFFCDGNWTVQNSTGLYGTVDKNGNTVIPFAYEFLSSFSEGMVAARQNGTYCFLDLTGKHYAIGELSGAAAGQIDAASLFNGGVTAVYQSDSGTAWCIQNVPQDGVLPAIAGTEELGYRVYFPDYGQGATSLGTLYPPSEYIVIEEDGRYGFARMTFRLDLPDESAMDYWAYDEVCRAIEAGLVPNELQNQYRSNITRADFALLMTEVAATITGKDVEQLVLDTTGKTLDEWVASYPFSDTTDRNVIAANALGILNGRGNGIFDPYASIQRQEAATMLLRGAVAIKADALEGWADKIAQSTIQFADGAAFAPYAQEAIRVMAALDVMKGTGNNRFSPTDSYTRQQSFMTVYRLMVQILDQAA